MRVLILALLLAGCAKPDTGLTTGIKIPELPAELAKRAEKLPENNDQTMGAQVLDNTSNIRAYNSKAFQVNDLIDIYNCVRTAVNEKKEIKCL